MVRKLGLSVRRTCTLSYCIVLRRVILFLYTRNLKDKGLETGVQDPDS